MPTAGRRGRSMSDQTLQWCYESQGIQFKSPYRSNRDKAHNDSSSLVVGSYQLTIPAGKNIALIGRSGSGKTSLLNQLAGLLSDQQAAGQWLGKSGAETGSSESRHQKPEISYLFQQPRLLPWRTLKQNLLLVDADQERVEQMLKEVGLGDYEDYYPANISLGMARRAALARALLLSPDLVLMDEPLASLDQTTANEMLLLIRRLILDNPNCALIYVTHSLSEALEIGDSIALLKGQPSKLTMLDESVGATVAELAEQL